MKATLSSLAFLCFGATKVLGQIPVNGQCGGGTFVGSNICEDGTFCTLVKDDFQCLALSPQLSYSAIATLPATYLTFRPPFTFTITDLPPHTSTTCTATPTTTTIRVATTVTAIYYQTQTITQTATVTIPTRVIVTQTVGTCSSTSAVPTTTTTITKSPPPPSSSTTVFNSTTLITTKTPPPTSSTNSTWITTQTPPPTSTTNSTTYIRTSTTSTTTSACPSQIKPGPGAGNFTYKGINIAGFEFGCYNDGSCPGPNNPPFPGYGTGDGPGQMAWFTSGGLNTFRLPIGWQFATPTLGGSFGSQWKIYDALVQKCLGLGGYCVVDIHNWARWNGLIIGQSTVVDGYFVKLWQLIANWYINEPRVIFGLMNAPHDLNLPTWANTLQNVVNGIRAVGAKNVILLPGTSFALADQFLSSGSATALNTITNPDGSFTNLIFDIQQWADKPDNGTDPNCVTNNVAMFNTLANWLRCHGRQAFLTETGGGNTQSCVQYICQQMQFLKANSDVFVGYTGWAAGSYDTTYVLDETPVYNPPWVDTLLTANCMYW